MEALRDLRLRAAYGNVTERFRAARSAAFAAFPEGDDLRDRARAIKDATLADLEGHLGRLTAAVEGLGGEVHRVADGAEARRVIVALAERYGVERVVKSKSMTTEEIGLNPALEAAGLEVVETDLGEFIIQLADESPAHIIAPAIHKTKEDVASLFVEKLGSPRLEEHAALTQEARRHLRDAFRSAEMGITGVNFAVAETGTLVVVENEGNARLVTSVPRVHVAVMGMEKVIPDLAALGVFLEILARSATGQKMSSYVSLVTGPRRPDERDGPEALHLVILDNGRSRLLADPVLREALCCIRCGACLNACPVYRHAGGHAYRAVYPGPIGSVITPTLAGQPSELPFASTLCGACRDVCPVRIDLPRLLLEQRKQAVAARPRRFERWLVRWFVRIMASAEKYRRASRWLRRLPRPPVPGWTRWRALPRPAPKTFRERWTSSHE